MALVKLPPRQRMINMMYLVLTAMLAMNVSKEVLDAFAVLDADLVRSGHAHEQRSQLEYAAFDDAAKKFPERFGDHRDKAHRVALSADSLVQRIERIKSNVIAEAEGKRMDQVIGKDATGHDSLLALSYVEAKDDRTTLTRLLVGSEPAAPKDGDGTAKDLKRRITAFRDELKELAGAGEPQLTASLDLLFSLDGHRDASGTMNNWESLNFYDVPLVAGIASLSKLQADIRGAENDMVKWLYRDAEKGTHLITSLTSAVIPQSSVVMLGDSFRADVFLAAYDRTNHPRIGLEGGNDLAIGEDGKGKLRLKADRVGDRSLEGVIHYQGPKGMEEFPYSTTFQVMAPMLVASPSKMNVLYKGVDNPMEFSVPGVPAENIRPMSDNGTIVRSLDGKGWIVRVSTGSKAHLSAQATMPDGSMRSIGPAELRVKDLPAPFAYVNGVSSIDTRCNISRLTAASGVQVKLGENCDFSEPFSTTHFSITVMRNGTPVGYDLDGGLFDQRAKDMVKALHNGDRIWFEHIKARLANGQGKEYDVAPISLKVFH